MPDHRQPAIGPKLSLASKAIGRIHGTDQFGHRDLTQGGNELQIFAGFLLPAFPQHFLPRGHHQWLQRRQLLVELLRSLSHTALV